MLAMARKRRFKAIAGIDPAELASFQTAIRRRYSDDQILTELRSSAERLGRSPTMKEFAADAGSEVHPQTVIEHFGTWNAAKRAAGLVPRRFVTREELLEVLRGVGEELGRPPTAFDIDERRGRMPSKSLYWHTFGSLSSALREPGFDVAVGEERLERAIEQGAVLARSLGHRRELRRGEERTIVAFTEPERLSDAARHAHELRLPVVERCRRHRAVQRLERARVAV